MRRFSVNGWRSHLGEICLIQVHLDWQPPYFSYESNERYPGWLCLTVVVFGFGASLTYWRPHPEPDVYGDGGVA